MKFVEAMFDTEIADVECVKYRRCGLSTGSPIGGLAVELERAGILPNELLAVCRLDDLKAILAELAEYRAARVHELLAPRPVQGVAI